jgi:hypothetical protein
MHKIVTCRNNPRRAYLRCNAAAEQVACMAGKRAWTFRNFDFCPEGAKTRKPRASEAAQPRSAALGEEEQIDRKP